MGRSATERKRHTVDSGRISLCIVLSGNRYTYRLDTEQPAPFAFDCRRVFRVGIHLFRADIPVNGQGLVCYCVQQNFPVHILYGCVYRPGYARGSDHLFHSRFRLDDHYLHSVALALSAAAEKDCHKRNLLEEDVR